jgi:hypothetical protein
MDGDRSEVQRLYDACGAVFSPRRGGGLPTLTQIRWLQDILGTSHDLIVHSCSRPSRPGVPSGHVRISICRRSQMG